MPTQVLSKKRATKESLVSLAPRWVDQIGQTKLVAQSEDDKIVWIIRNDLADRVVKGMSWPTRRRGYLLLIGSPRAEVIPALEDRFVRVAYAGGVLPKEELEAVLKSPERKDRFIGGIVNKEAVIVTLWRGDLTSLVVPFSAFPATANGIRPNWDRFAVSDYGHTLEFGDYEAAADSILYDYDPEFRRRLNKTRKATERTLGASIRRLRKQHQLTRHDFPGLDPKTLARIERSEVETPQSNTLKVIAVRLGVQPEELASY